MATLYLLKYNNYYNRIVKREASLSAYSSFVIGSALTKINFNPNDGIETEQIINWSLDTPDYLIVADEDSNIMSRWFVIEAARTRAKQFKLTLHRDVLADYYDDILESPAFIEKATVPDSNDLIFNQEVDRFNQIKKDETLLKDDTRCAWIVGYISSKDAVKGEETFSPEISGIKRGAGSPDISATSKQAFFNRYYAGLAMRGSIGSATTEIEIYGNNGWQLDFISQGGNYRQTQSFKFTSAGIVNLGNSRILGNYPESDYYIKQYLGSTITSNSTVASRGAAQLESMLTEASAELANNLSVIKPRNDLNNILENNGKIVYISDDDVYYKVFIEKHTYTDFDPKNITSLSYPSLSLQLRDMISDISGSGVLLQTWRWSNPTNITNSNCFHLTYADNTYETYTVRLYQIDRQTLTLTLPNDVDRLHLHDAPYDMFAIPYMDGCKFYISGTEVTLKQPFTKATAFNIAMEMAAQWSGVGFLYDIQLLPYCPLPQENLHFSGDVPVFQGIELGTNTNNYGRLHNSTDNYGYVPFCAQSKFEINLPYSIDSTEPKIENQCDMHRLASPNYGSYYDFNAARNGGVSGFNVDCQYKPYTPYIHINPIFGRLYGRDFNDPRGLICSAEFSLPVVTDQWETYQYQNKNYQNIFDRQIQNMDFNHKYDMIEQGVNAISGIVGGGSSGAIAGGMMAGGPAGLAVGAVVGGGLSVAGAVGDALISQKKYAEQKSYATDTFEMQLDNIRALPNTLTKVSSFNNNNKIFPVLEYYSCTDIEKEAFRNKMRYNGMTVNAIGTLGDYIINEPTFIKCKLIRLETVSDDFHLVGMIAEELSKGVFI